MGRWNRRYYYLPTRKKPRHYELEDPPPPDGTNSYTFSDAKESGLPSWEVAYCNSSKVPWTRVSASKRYIHCYPSVLNWDALAAHEALKNAKQRYLAMIDGRPCDNPLPDPDMYIDEIDWNPSLDSELMAELDLTHFDPDANFDGETECAQEQKNESTTADPWERNQEPKNGNLKDALHIWGNWDDSANMKTKDDAWRTGNESWDKQQRPSDFIDYGCGSSWTASKKNEAWRRDGWGRKQNSSWKSGAEGSGNSAGAGPKYGFRDSKNASWIRQESGNGTWTRSRREGNNSSTGCGENSDDSFVWSKNGNDSWGRDYSSNFKHGRRQFHDSYCKRDRSLQQTSKYHGTMRC